MNMQSHSSSIDYKQSIFTLNSYLKQLQYFSEQLQLNHLVEMLRDTRQRIDKNSLSIAIVGDFKRGKSTFINSLLGEEILPSDVLPTTATINRITYRLNPGAEVYFKDGSSQEIPIHKLSDYVTKLTSESEAIATTVKEATIYYPLAYCQNHQVEFIDTPGLNDEANMTTATLSALHQCEVAIMVISAHSPFSIDEGNFLIQNLLRNGIRRVFFIVNAIDLFNHPEEADRAIKLISDRIEKCIQQSTKEQADKASYLSTIVKPQIWGISAFQALQAKQTKNMKLLAESRFVNFEWEFKNILEKEGSLILLEVILHQVITAAEELIETLSIQASQVESQQKNLKIGAEKITAKIAKIRHCKEEMIISRDSNFNSITENVRTSVYRLESSLKKAANQILKSTEIKSSEQSSLSNKISISIQNSCSSLVQEIENETYCIYNSLAQNLHDFIEVFSCVIQQIKVETTEMRLDKNPAKNIDKKVLKISRNLDELTPSFPQLSFSFPSNLNTFVFEDEPNGAGTTVGSVIGFVLTAGNPIGGAVGAAIGAGIGNQMKENKFKENYPNKVISEIEKQVKLINANDTVNNYISDTFSPLIELYEQVIQDINLSIVALQTSLSESFAQQEARLCDQRRQIDQKQTEIKKILNNTQQLALQLTSITR